MPLHHVNASDDENFDALGVTGLSLTTPPPEYTSRNASSLTNRSSFSIADVNDGLDTSHHSSHHNNHHWSSSESVHSQRRENNELDHRPSFSSTSSNNYTRHTFTVSRQEPIYENLQSRRGEQHKLTSVKSGVNTTNASARNALQEEEDTQSLSTMDDSFSLSHQHSQQQYPPQNSQQPLPNQPTRLSFSQPRFRPRPSTATTTNTPSEEYTSQLESRVTQLSLELATTKSTLDEVQLQNRKLSTQSQQFIHQLTVLQTQNDELCRSIEKLEREKLVLSMETTKGVARCFRRRSSFIDEHLEKKKNNKSTANSTNSTTSTANTFSVSTFRVEPHSNSRSRSKGELEVPFTTTSSNRAELKRSYGSDAEFSIAESTNDGCLSVDALSLHSIGDLGKLMGDIVNSSGDVSVGSTSGSGREETEKEYDETDPFATWSAPEDRIQQKQKKNWFTRNTVERDATQEMGDPFDTVADTKDDPIQQLFECDSVEESTTTGGLERRQRFPLFRGLRGNRGQN